MWHGLGSAVQLGPCQALPSLSCSSTLAGTICEGGGISDVFQVKEQCPSPQPSPGHLLQHTFQPALLPLSASCFCFFFDSGSMEGPLPSGAFIVESGRVAAPALSSHGRCCGISCDLKQAEPHLVGSLLPL